jgi:hypothetical protein
VQTVAQPLTLSGRLERDTLDRMVRLARNAVPSSAGAVVCVLRDGAPAAVVGSELLAAQLQMAQLATGAGPSLLALTGRRTILVDPLPPDHPETWGGLAAAAGITGVVALPLGTYPDLAATLTLYHRGPRRWAESALEQVGAVSAVLGDLVSSMCPPACPPGYAPSAAPGYVPAVEGAVPHLALVQPPYTSKSGTCTVAP